MRFMYPLGLLGLIGIPIVIIIYILRSKYNEQTVTSNYLWKLSDKFLKKRNPLSGLTGLISLILQILTIAIVSLSLARPIFILKGMAYDYCFVLDTSASMNMEENGKTRFELAKEKISDIIGSSQTGSVYSLYTASDEAVKMFDRVTSEETARELLDDISPDYVAADHAVAVSAAQQYFNQNNSARIYYITDKSIGSVTNAEVITVGSSGENYSISGVEYTQAAGKLSAYAKVLSHNSSADLNVKLYLNDSETPAAETTVHVDPSVEATVYLECSATSFSSFRMEIANGDSYSYDNSITTHSIGGSDAYTTLIVSETGFFLRAVIDACSDSEVTVVTPEEYEKNTQDYGLYVFDSYTPSELPDAAVWLINCDKSVEDSGFGIRGTVSLEEKGALTKSNSSATAVRKMLDGVLGNEIFIKQYVKYSGMYLNFSTLFSYESNPLIFAGANGLGNRQVVFGFSLHESNIALTGDFIILIKNLLEYSFPAPVDRTDFTAGDEVSVNVLANAENLKAHSPSGKEIFLDSENTEAPLMLDEIGTYTISMTVAGNESLCNIYSSAPPEESAPSAAEDEFTVTGEPGNEKSDGEYDALTVLFISLIILLLADWGVYCYEKYQLR